MDSMLKHTLHLVWFLCTLQSVCAYIEPGIYKFKITEGMANFASIITKSMYEDTYVLLKTKCSELTAPTCNIKLDWALQFSECDNAYEDYYVYYDVKKQPMSMEERIIFQESASPFKSYNHYTLFGNHTYFGPIYCSTSENNTIHSTHFTQSKNDMARAAKTWEDGRYMLLLYMSDITECKYPDIELTVEFQSEHGYLSASQRPLLDFYAVMCVAYTILAILWFLKEGYQLTDFLKIKMKWVICIAILGGLLNSVLYYLLYHHVNSMGYTSAAFLCVVEIVPCLQSTAIRILLIIVSLGFRIIRVNIGKLRCVFIVGCCFLLFSIMEAYLRAQGTVQQQLVASIPLAILDVYIYYWIFTSLLGTIKTLELDHNVVELRLYCHLRRYFVFLIFMYCIYIYWSTKEHKFAICRTSWKTLWMDDAVWQILSYVHIVVVIILWRPTAGNCNSPFTITDYEDKKELLKWGRSVNAVQ